MVLHWCREAHEALAEHRMIQLGEKVGEDLSVVPNASCLNVREKYIMILGKVY